MNIKKIKLSFFIIFLLFTINVFAKDEEKNYTTIITSKKEEKKYLGIFYLNKMFGNVLKSPNIGAIPLKTFECGESFKVFESGTLNEEEWYFVQSKHIEGFIKKGDLSLEHPTCFKDKYPKFYEEIVFDAVEQYYWGALSSRYIKGETKVKLK